MIMAGLVLHNGASWADFRTLPESDFQAKIYYRSIRFNPSKEDGGIGSSLAVDKEGRNNGFQSLKGRWGDRKQISHSGFWFLY